MGSTFHWCPYLFPVCPQSSGCDLGCNLGWCLRRLFGLAYFKTMLGNIQGVLKCWGTIWITVHKRELRGSLLLLGGDQPSHGARFFWSPCLLLRSLGFTERLPRWCKSDPLAAITMGHSAGLPEGYIWESLSRCGGSRWHFQGLLTAAGVRGVAEPHAIPAASIKGVLSF